MVAGADRVDGTSAAVTTGGSETATVTIPVGALKNITGDTLVVTVEEVTPEPAA